VAESITPGLKFNCRREWHRGYGVLEGALLSSNNFGRTQALWHLGYVRLRYELLQLHVLRLSMGSALYGYMVKMSTNLGWLGSLVQLLSLCVNRMNRAFIILKVLSRRLSVWNSRYSRNPTRFKIRVRGFVFVMGGI
jgi:hypothetical protein